MALEAQRDSIRSEYIGPINAWAREKSVPHVRGD